MKLTDQWERVSDCVHPKHGMGVVYRPESFIPLTLKYEYEDGHIEYLSIYKHRRKVTKYGFLKKKEAAV